MARSRRRPFLWLVSRTVALPFGQFAHVVLPARFADALAQILAVVVVIGAAWLAVRGSAPARSASRVRGFALAAAIVIGALGVAGVISQANAFASAIVRSGEERVDVLLFVDQLTTNKGMEQPVTYKNQVTVTMQRVGDDWLVDDLVTSPAAG